MESIASKLQGKRVGLCLASGFFGFYHHAGLIEALAECGIRIARVTGNSAGALIGSTYAAGLEPRQIRDVLLALKRETFWDPQWPLTRYGFGMLAGQRFKAELTRALPVHRFEDCRIPLSVGVYGLGDGRVRHLSEGPLVQAVYASCAVPYMFTPEEIGGKLYWDGGFGEKAPLVPFLEGPEVDAVVVSFLPAGASRRPRTGSGWTALLPQMSTFFADLPFEERAERDRASVRVLRERGIDVYVLCPQQLRLGPFSLHRAPQAYLAGYEGGMRLLESPESASLGCTDLS